MYAIDNTAFGYRMTFVGTVDLDEFQSWLADSNRQIASASMRFGVLIDVRSLEPLSPRCQDILARGQQALRGHGMQRSAVVASKGYVARQLRMIARASGISENQRYWDAVARTNWEAEALAWIVYADEPSECRMFKRSSRSVV